MKKNKDKKEELVFDNTLVKLIQPKGGISFDNEKYVNTGNGYEVCLHLVAFPETVTDEWLSALTNIDGVISYIDINTIDQTEVKRNLSRSMTIQEDKMEEARNREEFKDARDLFEKMDMLHTEIKRLGEVVKEVHIRLFIYDKTLEGLEEKVKKIMNELDGDDFKTTILLNETKEEWESQFLPYEQQQKNKFCIKGLPLKSSALAGGNPFHFSSLNDQTGDYLGDTPCGGNVIFDQFTKTNKRTHYNALCCGTMGSGKSTLLKKLVESNAIKGHYIRIFDIEDINKSENGDSGGFTKLTNKLGGKIINFNGTSGGMVNPLEILASGDNEGINFTIALTKAKTTYQILVPSASSSKVTQFENCLREVYEKFNLLPNDGNKLTGLHPTKYPIFSDLLDHIIEKMNNTYELEKTLNGLEREVAKKNLLDLSELKEELESIVHNYGTLLNGYTSIPDLLNEQIVTFNIAELKKLGGEVFDAVIINLLSICWDNLIKNGIIMKSAYENDEIKWEDIIRFLIIIDESHNWVNVNKLKAVELLTMYQREDRKYFGGIVLASQSIRDYAPETTNNKDLEKIKDLFEFSQYKYLMKQPSSAIPLISKLFGDGLTQSQLDKIPTLEKGNMLLNIEGDKTIHTIIALSDYEEKLFSGGA